MLEVRAEKDRMDQLQAEINALRAEVTDLRQ